MSLLRQKDMTICSKANYLAGHQRESYSKKGGSIAEIIHDLDFDRLASQQSPLLEILCADFSTGTWKMGVIIHCSTVSFLDA